MVKYTAFTETNLFADLDEIDAWLAERGITQRNRLRIYRQNLLAMRERERKIGAGEVYAEAEKSGRLTEVLASYVEGAEFVDALTTLRNRKVDIPDELLRRALDGSPDAALESAKNNQGRNAMFELSIGAMIARQHFQPTLSTGNPDVEFQFENRRVLMECKRALSEAGVLQVLEDGIHQLRKQVKSSNGVVGLIAVDISRVFYRGEGYWVAPANSDVHEILSEMIRRFLDSIGDRVLRMREAAATGALFYAAAPFRIEGLGYTPARAGTFCAFDLNRDEFLARLATSLRL